MTEKEIVSELILCADDPNLPFVLVPDASAYGLGATIMLHYAQILQGFDYEISYRSTERRANADALSRIPISENNQNSGKSIDGVTTYQLSQILITCYPPRSS